MSEKGIPLPAALQTLVDARQDDQVVVTSMGATREWPKLSQHPLDFHYVPSTMGGVVPLGLGLAMSQPQRGVFVFVGDGSLVMSLGCLISVAANPVENLTVILLDNGVYEVTGGQKQRPPWRIPISRLSRERRDWKTSRISTT